MSAQDAAAAWPEGVVEAAARAIYIARYGWAPTDDDVCFCADEARAALAAIAPYVAAERAAAWIAGRDASVRAARAHRWHKSETHLVCLGRSNHASVLVKPVVAGVGIATAIAALTPPDASALDAYVAARVAEAVAKETEAKREAIARIIQGACDLPDRNSPEDQPEMLLITVDELDMLLQRHLGFEDAAIRATPGAPP